MERVLFVLAVGLSVVLAFTWINLQVKRDPVLKYVTYLMAWVGLIIVALAIIMAGIEVFV